MFLGLLLKKTFRDSIADRRAADIAYRLTAEEQNLDKVSELLQRHINSSKIDVKEVHKLIGKQEEIIKKIIAQIKELHEYEFASIQEDIREPQQAFQDLFHALEEGKNGLKQTEIRNRVNQLIKEIHELYLKVEDMVKKELSVIIEAYSREVSGVESSYSHSAGSVQDIIKLIEARELQKKQLDKHIAELSKRIRQVDKELKEYLKKVLQVQLPTVNGTISSKIKDRTWIRVKDKEFSMDKNGRWRYRDASSPGAMGAYASVKILDEYGIYSLQVSAALEHFHEVYTDLINYILQRLGLTNQVLSNLGYFEHKILQLPEKNRELLKHSLLQNSEEERKELLEASEWEVQEVKKEEKKAIGMGQISMANVKASESIFRRALAGTAAMMAMFIGMGAAHAPQQQGHLSAPSGKEASSHTETVVEYQEVEKVGYELTTEQRQIAFQTTFNIPQIIFEEVRSCVGTEVKDQANFPFDVSGKLINGAENLDQALPNIVKALVQASFQAGYKGDYKTFVKDQGITIKVNVSGYASPEGKTGYNLKLSKSRADHVGSMIEAWSKEAGVPIEIDFVEGKGELDSELKDVLADSHTREEFGKQISDSLSQGAAKVQFNRIWKALSTAKNDKQYSVAFESLMKFIHLIPQLDQDVLAPLRKAVVEWQFAYQKVEPSMRIKFNPIDVKIDQTIRIPKLVKVVTKEKVPIIKVITVYKDVPHGSIKPTPKKIDLQKSEAIVSQIDMFFGGSAPGYTPYVAKLKPQTSPTILKGGGGRGGTRFTGRK